MLSTTAAPKLRLTHIGHAFQVGSGAPLQVLDDVTFDVKAREFITIVGGSGSGKTTLLRIIDRLLKASEGEVRARLPPTREIPRFSKDKALTPGA